MKSLKRLFRKIGEADVHVWGYSSFKDYGKENEFFS